MPVSLVVGDIASFRKYVKLIGRAYQKRSVAMIQLCRLFLEISPGKPDQMDALRSLFETVEDALKSAVDAGKERSEAADTAFATAEEELDWYAAWHHPKQQGVLGDVQNIIEDAAQKDSYIMKTHKRLSTRLGLNKTDSPPSRSLVKVHFQILRSPTDRREAPVVTCELGPDVTISELLWTLSRLPEDQRISLKQNPHFYFSRDLSDQASAYGDQFKLEPLKDLRPEKDSVVLVLLDRAGQIFVDYQKFSKTYGNIWRPYDAIILKDLQGTLEAANRISPKISGDVCIWQRGGGRPEGDLSKWTEVLERALEFPDVDWLIRSETSPDEAFDIEVTGGWERCSPVTTPEPPHLFRQDNPTITAHSHEGTHVPTEETPSLSSLPSPFAPTVVSTNQKSSHSSQDIVRSDVTVDLSSEEAQSNVEDCQSPVEGRGYSALNTPSSESTPEAETAVHLPVHSASIYLDSSTSQVEIEPTLFHNVSATKRPEEGSYSQDEATPAETILAPSTEPLILPLDISVTPNSQMCSREPLENSPVDNHSHTKATHPCAPSAHGRSEFSLPKRSEQAPAGPACPPDSISELNCPRADAIQTALHLEPPPSGRLTPPISSNPDPSKVAPARTRTTPSDGTLLRVEAVHPPIAPDLPPESSSPALDRTALASHTTRSEIDHTAAKSARPPVCLIPTTESETTLASDITAPDRIPPILEHVSSRVEVVRRPSVNPPAAPAKPSFPIRKNPTPTEANSASHLRPSSVQRVRPQVEGAHTLTPLKSSVSSIAVGCISPRYGTPTPSGRAHTQSEAPRAPMRTAHAPLDPRTKPVGKQTHPINSLSVPDTKANSSSRSAIKSHPRRMVTPTGQRRSTVLSVQLNLPPNVSSSGQPMVRSAEPVNFSTENRGRYQSYATGPMQVPLMQINHINTVSTLTTTNNTSRMSSQEPIDPSRRSTALAGQMIHLSAVASPDKLAPRPVDKPARSSASNRKPVEASFHSTQPKFSRLEVIPAAQGAPKGNSMARSATPSKVLTAEATPEKLDAAAVLSPSVLPNGTISTSSILPIKDSAASPRKSMVLPEQMTSQPSVRSLYQPVIRSRPAPYTTSNKSNFTNPVAKTCLGRPDGVHSHNSRTNLSGVTVATETRSDNSSAGLRVCPTMPVGSLVANPTPSTWNSKPPIPRIKTKDLISRHKQQSTSNVRPPISENGGVSKASTSHVPQPTLLDGKPTTSHIDSGIEIWDYEHHGPIPARRVTSSNGHGNPSRTLGPSFSLSINSPVGASNTSDSSSPSVSLKKSRTSIRGSHGPVTSKAHSGTQKITPPSLEQVQTPLLSAAGSSAGSLASVPLGRREPFINRKPQPTSQSTTPGGAAVTSGFSTPPRSSTPSSMSHPASIATSTQATTSTPATSFTIPSRVPSPASEAGHKSWFRRNVIDLVKSKLGYGS